jgi:hypothetical protein
MIIVNILGLENMSVEQSSGWKVNRSLASQEILSLFRTRWFITVVTWACCWFLSWARWI